MAISAQFVQLLATAYLYSSTAIPFFHMSPSPVTSSINNGPAPQHNTSSPTTPLDLASSTISAPCFSARVANHLATPPLAPARAPTYLQIAPWPSIMALTSRPASSGRFANAWGRTRRRSHARKDLHGGLASKIQTRPISCQRHPNPRPDRPQLLVGSVGRLRWQRAFGPCD